MLAVSADFLQAIKDKAPQDVRLEFAGGDVIGTSDIAITAGGLTYTEILNGETDVTFGRAVMSELSVMLINADGRFTDFDFAREFTAKVGVEASQGAKVTHSGTQVSWTDEAAGYTFTYWVYSTTAIRFRRQAIGSNTSTATSLTCSNAAIVITYNDMVYAVGADYNIIKVWRRSSPTSHGVITVPVGLPAGITDAQLKSWVDSKTCVRVEEQEDGFVYVPLGVFKGERPEKVRGKLINFTAHDRMSLFDKPAEAFADGLTFPCTLGQIYTKLCDFCGAGYVSAEFPNSGKTFDTNPLEDTDYTCREILGYIAEAAGSYARMSRDGAVELVWFADADYTVTRTDRFEMTESEFLTPPVDKLEVYNSYGDQLNSSGTGEIVYGISDNPFLYIENDTQLEGLQPYVDAIYSRVTSLSAYHPSSFRAEFNPAVQCGDIISVVDDYGETISFPVFVLTLTWNGGGKTVYENTGGVIRQNAPFTQRELEQIKKKSVKTKDLWTYVDSYLSSPEGVASINTAVGGNFATKDDLTGFVTESELNVAVEAYINGEEGIAKLTESLSGTFVTVREYGNNITLTATSQMFVQAEGSDGYSPSSITLTANTDGDLTFAWYKDGTLLSGKTAKTLTVHPADIADSSATYKVVGTDADNKTYSDQMTLAKLREGKGGADGASGYTMVLSNEYIEVPVTEKRFPKTARTYSCVVSVYSGTTKMTAVTGTPAAGQFKVTTPAGVTGITVSQSPAGTVKLTVSTGTAIGDINEFSFNVEIYGGVTLPAKITMTANMNDIAAGAYEVTSNIDSRIEKYITDNSGDIADILKGEFVTVNMLDGYAKTTEVSALITRSINSQGASLTLSTSKGVTERTATSEVVGTYFEDWDFNIPGKDEGYGFEFHWDGSWYTSQNAGVNNSYSIGFVDFNFATETLIALQYVYSAEEWGDYGIISQLDSELRYDTNVDSVGVLMALYEESSTAVKEIFMKIPAGEHHICFKYVKDDSYFSGNDSFKVRAVRAVETTVSEEGASLTLMNGSAILSATDITFEGYVTFKSLSEPGSTVINGANITTGKISADRIDTSTLYAKQVLLNTDDGDYPMISSELSDTSNTAYVKVGVTDDNGWAQFVDIYGTYVRFGRPGYNIADDSKGFVIDMVNQKMFPNDKNEWNIAWNTSELYSIWARRHGFYDNTYLRVTSGELRFYYPVGQNADDEFGYEYDYVVLAEYDDNY